MQNIYKILLFQIVLCTSVFGQIGNYYSTITLQDSALQLKDKLSQLIAVSHTTSLSYTPGVWNTLKIADLNPDNSNEVILVYGYDVSSNVTIYDRTRGVNNNGGSNLQWNREHVYAKALGTPNLNESGPGSDAHHIRPADVQFNGIRGNKKFGDNTGNATVNPNQTFYPGDEWKGDVARMMMYMYVRYGNRCLPNNVGDGVKTISRIDDMIDLFILWHEQDPVSDLEVQRNNQIARNQGNRNPFIDHPEYVAKIWRTATPPEDPDLASSFVCQTAFSVYPNPAQATVNIFSNHGEAYVYTMSDAMGRIVFSGDQSTAVIDLSNHQNGTYILQVVGERNTKTMKIVKQ